MPIFQIDDQKITPVKRTSFEQVNIRERADLQRMLKSQIEIISPDTLIVSEEFGEWEDSKRRIDLLGIDKNANLIVIELKRTEDGGYMELQAIRYAAMISTLTFEKLVQTYSDYLSDNNIDQDATESLLSFLGWAEVNEEEFAQDIKIILVSAEFSKELTTSVVWLNDMGLDIRCVRLHPYINGQTVLLDIQTIIPVPEVADLQIKIQEKKQRERQSRTSNKDYTKYDLTIKGKNFKTLSKRQLMFHIIAESIQSGVHPEELVGVVPKRTKKLFEVFEGTLTARQVYDKIMEKDTAGEIPRNKRFFSEDGEFFHLDGKTYVLSNQWGISTLASAQAIQKSFPQLNILLQAQN